MLSNQFPLDVVWSTPQGRETPLGSAEARIDVTPGVKIDIAFETLGPAGVVVDLTLSGRRPVGDGSGQANARFVIIPLSESGFLVAVAEPSAEAVNLMPVASTPVWAGGGGDRMPTRAFLAARRPQRVGLFLELMPGPGEMDVCALRISSASPLGPQLGLGQASQALSILRLSQEIARIAVGSGGHLV